MSALRFSLPSWIFLSFPRSKGELSDFVLGAVCVCGNGVLWGHGGSVGILSGGSAHFSVAAFAEASGLFGSRIL